MIIFDICAYEAGQINFKNTGINVGLMNKCKFQFTQNKY